MAMTSMLQTSAIDAEILSDFCEREERRRKKKREVRDYSRYPQEVIPKGCKKYYFSSSGILHNSLPKGTESVFECIASSEKVARRKFDKWNK